MKKDKEVVVLDKHIHIDNGGYTFEYVAYNNGDDEYYGGGLVISNSFFGYSNNEMTLSNLNEEHLEKLGLAFIAAAAKLKELNRKSGEK